MLLLCLVYLVFVGVGLPDSLLGTAWPFMSAEFQIDVGSAGILSMTISAGIITASLTAYRVVRRLGFGKTAALGLLLIAVSLGGYALSGSIETAWLFSFPLGLGSGTLQTLFNDFVAENYTARHMNWLHGAWGIGAVTGPLVLSAFSTMRFGWRGGYWAVAAVEAALFGAIVLTLPRWARATTVREQPASSHKAVGRAWRSGRKICMAGQFFLYCSMENAVMLWGASYLVNAKAMDAALAAQGVSLFFLGVTVGRFLGGMAVEKIGNEKMIAVSILLAVALDMALAASAATAVILLVFLLLGCAMAPIYPAMLHQTPAFFSNEDLHMLMGIQLASAYVGILIVPSSLGKLFSAAGFYVLPFVQAVCLAGVLLCVTLLRRKKKEDS